MASSRLGWSCVVDGGHDRHHRRARGELAGPRRGLASTSSTIVGNGVIVDGLGELLGEQSTRPSPYRVDVGHHPGHETAWRSHELGLDARGSQTLATRARQRDVELGMVGEILSSVDSGRRRAGDLCRRVEGVGPACRRVAPASRALGQRAVFLPGWRPPPGPTGRVRGRGAGDGRRGLARSIGAQDGLRGAFRRLES